jgi:hypothetical protein
VFKRCFDCVLWKSGGTVRHLFLQPLVEPNGTQPNPRRHQVRIPGDIISECPGDFVGMLEGSNRSRVTDLAARSARDLFEAGLNEAASG